MATDSCSICTELYNKKDRFKIKCQYCDFESCRKCSKTYLLNETKPKCMNNDCDREWTRQFLRENFTKVFLNEEYKKHRENILFNTERALMPSTQPLVENQIRKEKINVEILNYRKQLSDLNQNIFRLQNEYYQIGRRNPNTIKERSQFIKACTDPNCRGFLSTQWKCGICEKWTCPNCHILKETDREREHECNPDDILTASLINNDTKSCPTCGTGIFKIDGCDQMFCTQCNTSFSWRTGRIETNHIHNPHYFEWLRRNGNEGELNNNENIPCRELTIDNYFLRVITNILNSTRIKNSGTNEEINDLRRKLYQYCENITHLHRIQYPYYHNNNYPRMNEELRIQYMRNMITEEKFKLQIQQIDKKSQKMTEISNILNMVIITSTDIIHRFYNEMLVETWVYNIETLKEIDRILEYANNCLIDISKTYNSKQLVFNEFIRLV